MNKRDVISGLFWMAFGAVFAVGGLQHGLVRQGIPGPGSLPFIMGLITMALSIVVFLQALRKESAPPKFFPAKSSLRKLALAVAGILGYGFFLKSLGFMATTFLFLYFVLSTVGRERWFTALSFSLATAVLSYFLFTALQVELPRGILGM